MRRLDLVSAPRQTDSPALYLRPRDPRTAAQVRSRTRLVATSKRYSYALTEKQHNVCIAAGAKLRSRPRLNQSGPLTGQQYSIQRQYALDKAHRNGAKTAFAPQVLKPQQVKVTSWEPRRGVSRVAPDRRRPGTGRASLVRGGKSIRQGFPAARGAARARRPRGSGRGPLRTQRPSRYAPPGPRASAAPARSAYRRKA